MALKTLKGYNPVRGCDFELNFLGVDIKNEHFIVSWDYFAGFSKTAPEVFRLASYNKRTGVSRAEVIDSSGLAEKVCEELKKPPERKLT